MYVLNNTLSRGRRTKEGEPSPMRTSISAWVLNTKPPEKLASINVSSADKNKKSINKTRLNKEINVNITTNILATDEE